MTTIRDGTGGGYIARVSSTNRLSVTSETVSAIAVASLARSSAYVVGTQGGVALTSAAGESAVLYLLNSSETPLVVGGFAVSSNQAGTWTAYRNPIGGTITSSGTAVTPVNFNFSSGNTLNGTALKGADGLTTTGGVVLVSGYTPIGFTNLDVAGALVLGTGSVLTLTYTPDADATVTANILVAYADGG